MNINLAFLGLCILVSVIVIVICALVTFRAIKEEDTDKAILFGGLTVVDIYCLCIHISKLIAL